MFFRSYITSEMGYCYCEFASVGSSTYMLIKKTHKSYCSTIRQTRCFESLNVNLLIRKLPKKRYLLFSAYL